MATDYGTSILALTDLPDPAVLGSGEVAAAYQLARRWMTPSGAMADLGEVVQYESIDVREWLGLHLNLSDKRVLADLESQALQALLDDPIVTTAVVTATFGGGALTLTAQGQGAQGPFSFVLNVNQVTAQLLLPGQT